MPLSSSLAWHVTSVLKTIMFTKQKLDESIFDLSASLKCEFKKLLDESISAMKDNIVKGLKPSNDDLQHKVEKT